MDIKTTHNVFIRRGYCSLTLNEAGKRIHKQASMCCVKVSYRPVCLRSDLTSG